MTESCRHITGTCACAKVDPAKLHQMTDDQLFMIDQFLDGIIYDVLKVNEQRRIDAIETRLSDLLYTDYSKKAKKAADQAIDIMRRRGETITGNWSNADIQAIAQPIADAVGESFARTHAIKIVHAAAGILLLKRNTSHKSLV